MLSDFFQSPILMIGIMVLLAIGLVVILLKAPVEKDPDALKAEHSPSPADSMADLHRSGFFEYVNQGNEHLNHYQWDQALACFQAAVKIKPNEPTIHFKIGRIYAQKEDYKHAITAFRNVLSINEEHAEAYFELARVYQSLNQFDEAHKTLEKVLELNPNHEEALKLKIRLYEQVQQYLHALPVLQKLMGVSKYANHRKYRMQYAEMLVLAGKPTDAVAEYQGLIEQDSMNKALYESKIANLFYDMGQYNRAIEYYRRIFYADDALSNSPEIKSRMAAALCNEGVRYYKELTDSQSAVQFYKEALKYDTNNPDIYYNLGKAYLDLGQLENGRKNLEQALEMVPHDTLCAYELAMLEDHQGNIEPAMRHYRAVLTLDPKHAMAAYGLGSLYGVQGDLDKCVEYLTRAIQINPSFEDAIYNLGVALERLKQPNKAIQMYKKVLSLNSNHEQAKSNLTHLQHNRI